MVKPIFYPNLLFFKYSMIYINKREERLLTKKEREGGDAQSNKAPAAKLSTAPAMLSSSGST